MTAATTVSPSKIRPLPTSRLIPNPFNAEVYGDAADQIDDLLPGIERAGILVPLVVVPDGSAWEVLSGHRRLACARRLGLSRVPCEVREVPLGAERRRAILEYNRQRRKTFSQFMREADAFETLLADEARGRSRANLRRGDAAPERRDSDARAGGRTDAAVAHALGFGGKDLYRQARAVWRVAQAGDPRARAAVAQLDAGTKTIHAAYKDLRRRDQFTAGFRPTPYDVWPFRHDPAYGIAHPGSIPPAIVSHALHYYSGTESLVVDPMAGGGTTLDVCLAMGRRCLAYDLHPVRPDIVQHDIARGFPAEAHGCDLIFCDPPYHTMLARRYEAAGAGDVPLSAWIAFLQKLAADAFATLRPGGHIALLLANQTEKDLPAGFGYIDHVFLGYGALVGAGFVPERRVSCPMSGGYLPQHVRRARQDGRMLGLVRDLIIMRKPADGRLHETGSPPASA